MDTRKAIGLLSIAAFLLLIGILALLKIPTSYEHPYLLAVLNTAFTGIIPIAISCLVASVFLRKGDTGLLLIGSGLLLFGLGSVAAGWVSPLTGGPNMNVTIYNTCACGSAVLIFAGCFLFLGSFEPFRQWYRSILAMSLYGAAMIFFLAILLTVLNGSLPPFVIPGAGFTTIRQVILENAVIFFALSSIILLVACRGHDEEFISWYAIAFGLMAVGLLAVLLQPSVGSLLGWTGRAAQFLGCTFALYAVILAHRISIRERVPLESLIAGVYRDPQKAGRFSTKILDTVADGVILTRPDDGCIIYTNPSFDTLFGYTRGELLGKNVAILNAAQDKDPAEIAEEIRHYLQTEDEWHGTLCNIRKDGTRFWSQADITSFDDLDFGTVWVCTQRDITGERNARDKLRESEEKYRALADNSPDYIFILDRDDTFKYVNRAALAKWGVGPVSGIIGKKRNELFPPEIAGLRDTAFKKIFETGQPDHFEEEIPVGAGNIWIDVKLVPLKDKSGNVMDVLGVARDISEWKQNEQKIREFSERLKLATRAGNVGIWDWDVVNNQAIWDEQMYRLYGISADKFSGAYDAWQRGLHPDDKTRGDAEIQMALRGEREYDTEFRVLWPDGSIHHIRSLALVQRDNAGNPVRMIGTNWDITRRKQTEEELREGQARLLAVLEGINEPSYVSDPETHELLFVNKALEDQLGLPGTMKCFEYLQGRDTPCPFCTNGIIFGENLGSPYVWEYKNERNGHIYKCVDKAIPWPDGRSVRFELAIDITERKRAEDAVRKANRQLNLLGSITRHDILNKVMAAKGYLGFLQKGLKDPTLEEYAKKTGLAIDAIRSQIAFTKVYQELGSQDPQWQNLSAIIANLSIPSTITLKSSLQGLEIFADPMLEKVFFNLLDNSIGHGEHCTDIVISSIPTDNDLRIVWEDNGIGIPLEEKDKIFERGFGKNTGLGLFLVREILSLTDITILENGEPGKGARFEITVPKGMYRLES